MLLQALLTIAAVTNLQLEVSGESSTSTAIEPFVRSCLDCLWRDTFEVKVQVSKNVITGAEITGKERPRRACYQGIFLGGRLSLPDGEHTVTARVFDPDEEAKRLREEQLAAQREKQRLEEERLEAERTKRAEERALTRENDHLKCPPWPPKERGIRFPYGIPRGTTYKQLYACVSNCAETENFRICDLISPQDLTIEIGEMKFTNITATFAGTDDDSQLFAVRMSDSFDECEDAVGVLTAAHALIRTKYAPKGSRLKKGEGFGSKRCADYMHDDHAFLASSTRDWVAKTDISYDDGKFTVYFAIFNTKAAEKISREKAKAESETTIRSLGKL